ncbi:dihydrolipoamide acetyltransferase family protein [Gemmatimonadota bacterium]
MATKVHMEALSPTMEEGQVVKWLKSEGDSVANGEILAEIETDKAIMELVARGDGVLRRVLVGEGETAPVGEVIAVIGDPEEDLSGIVGEAGEAEEEKVSQEPPVRVESDPVMPASPAEAGSRLKASPLARRMAQESLVDLGQVQGSGPGGRIVKRDVEAARSAGTSVPLAGPSGAPSRDPGGPEFADEPLSQMRKTIAKRLTESLGPVPHFFLRITVDMTRILEARKRINGLLAAEGEKISINDFILKATAQALARHPEVNSSWTGASLRRFFRVHLAVAVAVEDGLITPVVRDADRKGLLEISREVQELAARGREKKLLPEEYTGSTFSVSNLGMFGIQEFTGVINPPEGGILAVGGVEETPVAEEGEIRIRPIMRVTMSCDHRVIDGATGARFLQTLKGMLEEPAAILL